MNINNITVIGAILFFIIIWLIIILYFKYKKNKKRLIDHLKLIFKKLKPIFKNIFKKEKD